MLVYRSAVATVALAGVWFAGCADPEELTDLRTDGPPDVTTVTVMSDLETGVDPNPIGMGRIVETATYCRLRDEKRPGLVGLPDIRAIQVCPDDLKAPALAENAAQAAPPVWFVRIVFDELLDPAIEDLVPVLDQNGTPTDKLRGTFRGPNHTQPVTLTCNGAEIDYDGYYIPNGNRSSWPLGPALFVAPIDPTSVPTGASCAVSIKDNVHNKAGQSVPVDQRRYSFQLGPMELRFSNPDPADSAGGAILHDLNAPVDFFWTAALRVDPVTGSGKDAAALVPLGPGKVRIVSGGNVNISTSNPAGDPDPAVCGGSGDDVSSQARAYVAGETPDPTSDALVMHLDLKGGAAPLQTSWAANTTYLIEFAADARVPSVQSPADGSGDGAFPAGYQLCFHTPAS